MSEREERIERKERKEREENNIAKHTRSILESYTSKFKTGLRISKFSPQTNNL